MRHDAAMAMKHFKRSLSPMFQTRNFNAPASKLLGSTAWFTASLAWLAKYLDKRLTGGLHSLHWKPKLYILNIYTALQCFLMSSLKPQVKHVIFEITSSSVGEDSWSQKRWPNSLHKCCHKTKWWPRPSDIRCQRVRPLDTGLGQNHWPPREKTQPKAGVQAGACD